MIKKCKRCNEEKDLASFPTDRTTKSRGEYCRPCKARMAVRAWHIKYPEKRQAHRDVCTALRNGVFKRPNKCEWCGIETYTLAHHGDYSKPLQVNWICDKCHGKHHRDERLNGKKGGHPKKRSVSHMVLNIPKEGVVVVDGIIHKMPTLPMGSKMKCQSPYCPSFDTKEYQRSTGTFWLCDTHKP